MVSDADMLVEMDARLAAVADVQFALVQKLSQQIEEAEDATSLAALSEPLERCARSIRLTYALRVKLRKDVRQIDRDETRARTAEHNARHDARRQQIHVTVQDRLWREFEREEENECADLENHLERVLNDELDRNGFMTEDPAEIATRVIAALGFEITEAGDIRRKPPPTDHWRSSA